MKMATAMSSKGQVVLPKSVRERRGWHAGTRLTVVEVADGVLLKQEKSLPATALDEVVGSLWQPGKAKTLAEMDAGIARAVKRRHGRG